MAGQASASYSINGSFAAHLLVDAVVHHACVAFAAGCFRGWRVRIGPEPAGW